MNGIKQRTKIIAVAGLAALCVFSWYVSSLKTGPEFHFVKEFAGSLRYQKSAFKKHAQIPPPKFDNKRANLTIEPFLENMRSANADLKKAKEIIARFRGTRNVTVKKAAASVLSLYDKQVQLSDRSLALYKKIYDAGEMEKLGAFAQGKLASEARKLPEERQELDRLLIDAAILVTHMLYSDTPDKEGKLNRLSLTAHERRSLIKLIDADFSGKETIADACAGQIRQVLTGKYKSKNQP